VPKENVKIPGEVSSESLKRNGREDDIGRILKGRGLSYGREWGREKTRIDEKNGRGASCTAVRSTRRESPRVIYSRDIGGGIL